MPSYATIICFCLNQECEDRVRFAINSARVYPLLQLHYYIQSRPDEVQNPKPSATIQPSDSGPLIRRRDRLLHPPPQADHLAPPEEYSSKKSHWDRESENDPPRPKNCWRGQNLSKNDFVRALWLCRRLKFSFVGLFLIKFLNP